MRINIALKLFLGFLVLVFLNVFFIVIVSKLGDLNVLTEILKKQNDIKNQILKVGNLLQNQKRSLVIYTDLMRDESVENFIENGEEIRKNFRDVFETISKIQTLDSSLSRVPLKYEKSEGLYNIEYQLKENVFSLFNEYIKIFDELVTHQHSPKSSSETYQRDSISSILENRHDQLVTNLNATDSILDKQNSERIQEVEARINYVKQLTLMIVIGISIISVAFSLIFSNAITTSLRKLRESTRTIATGDFDFDPQGYPRDEIGDLANAFYEMYKDLKKEPLIRNYPDWYLSRYFNRF